MKFKDENEHIIFYKQHGQLAHPVKQKKAWRRRTLAFLSTKSSQQAKLVKTDLISKLVTSGDRQYLGGDSKDTS